MSKSKRLVLFVLVACLFFGCLSTIDDADQEQSFDLEGESGGNWLEFFDIDDELIDNYSYVDYRNNYSSSGDIPTSFHSDTNLGLPGTFELDTDE